MDVNRHLLGDERVAVFHGRDFSKRIYGQERRFALVAGLYVDRVQSVWRAEFFKQDDDTG